LKKSSLVDRICLGMTALWTAVAIGPSRCEEILTARLLRGEATLELGQRSRKVRAHRRLEHYPLGLAE
jgi:hypothetical protein